MLVSFLVICFSKGNASPVYNIENLDDLFDAYYSGMIDYTTFSILYNAYDLGGLTGDDLEALNISDRTELYFLLNPEDSSGFWQELLNNRNGQLGFRRYSRDKDYIYSNYYADFFRHGFNLRFDIRKLDEQTEFRRRSIGWRNEYIELKTGNYLVKQMYGLTIGRYDYQPSAGYGNESKLNLLSPSNSYYNGFAMEINRSNFHSGSYYSYKEYDNYDKTFAGGSITYESKRYTVSIISGWNKIYNGDKDEEYLAIGTGFEINMDDYSLGGEYALVEKSAGVYLKASKQAEKLLIQSEFWHYADHFCNFNCSGPAASDYESFYPLDDELGFRSTQAGETGVSISYHVTGLDAGLQMWNQSGSDFPNSSIYARSFHDISESIRIKYQLSYKNTETSRYFWMRVYHDMELPVIDRLGLKTYYDDGNFIRKNSYAYSDHRYEINRQFALTLKLRFYMDNQIYWYIGESLETAPRLRLRGEVSYRDYARINIKIEKAL